MHVGLVIACVVGLVVAVEPSQGAGSVSQPAQTGAIAGKVVDELAILPGATVKVISQDGVVREGVTDVNGDYRFGNLAPGAYRVQVELPGFLTSTTDSVTVVAGRTVWHDAELKLAPNTTVTESNVRLSTGGIAGRVTDSSGGVLPGVTVTLSGPTVGKAITSSRGEYLVDALQPGLYRLTLTLPGFRPGSASLTVAAGRRVRASNALRLGLFYIVDYVMPPDGVPGALREADVVAHIRLNRPVGVRVVNDAIIVTDHEATVVNVVKTDQASILPGASVRFAQEGAGVWVEDGYRAMGAERPYEPGDSFLAFLRRDKDSTLTEYRGEAFMWPVKQGFVIPVYSAGATTLRSPMPVDEAVAVLRKLLARQ